MAGFISRAAHRYLRLKQDYRQVFSGPAGEAVLADLLRACRMEHIPIVPGDAISSGEMIGRQSIGRHLQNSLHLPDAEIIRRANQAGRQQTEGAENGEETDEF
jgi:hypothetical protein